MQKFVNNISVWYSKKNAIWLGWFSIWLSIGIFIIFTTVNILSITISHTDLPKSIAPTVTILYYFLFIIFLLGIRRIGEEKDDINLINNINNFILINVFEMFVFYPYSFASYFESNFLTLTLVASIPLFSIHGIFLLKITECFNKYLGQFNFNLKRVIWWNKVGGWMLASVIFILPGLFFAFIGQFFLWRFLAFKLKN